MPTVYTNNLRAMAKAIIEGCRISFEGDSLYSTNSPRMQQGIAQHWRVNAVKGWVTPTGCQIFDGSLGGASASRTLTTRSYNWYTGSTTVAPCDINELKWTANEANSSGVLRATANATASGWFPGGDPWAQNSGDALTDVLKCDWVWWADATSVGQLRFRGRRSTDTANNDEDNVTTNQGTAGYMHKEVTIPTSAAAGGGVPAPDILTATGFNEFAGSANSFWWPICARFYRPNVTGTEFSFVPSHGGYTATMHTEEAKCSTARRTDFYNYTGRPNLFWLSLGTNNGDYVSGSQWKALIKAIIDNRRAICATLGVTPMFVLENPYLNLGTNSLSATFGQALYELSQENADVGYINTAALCASYAVLDGDGSGSAFLNADDIHQNAMGASYFPLATWAALAGEYSRSGVSVAASSGVSGSRVSRINRVG